MPPACRRTWKCRLVGTPALPLLNGRRHRPGSRPSWISAFISRETRRTGSVSTWRDSTVELSNGSQKVRQYGRPDRHGEATPRSIGHWRLAGVPNRGLGVGLLHVRGWLSCDAPRGIFIAAAPLHT